MIKLTDRYKPREVMGELLLVPCGEELNNFNGMKTLNGIGRDIYNALRDGCDEAETTARILDKYEADETEVKADVREFIEELVRQGVAEKI